MSSDRSQPASPSGRLRTPHPLPTPAEIQGWILEITPHAYFETFVESPGLLVLRVKGPRGEYQGLHLAISPAMAGEVASVLSRLEPGASAAWTASYPGAGPWISLFASRAQFRAWLHVEVSATTGSAAVEVMAAFHSPNLVRLSATTDALRELARLIDAPTYPMRPTPFRLVRSERPHAQPHHLWLWRWR